MHSYSIWNEGGGVGKTSSGQALLASHAKQGLDVLAVDVDAQKGGISSFFGLLDQAETANGDDLVDFLANDATDDIHELITTVEGIDFIPGSRRMRDLDRYLEKVGGPRIREAPDEALRLLVERNELHEEYDLMVVDTPGGIESVHPKLGLFATRNVLIPIEPSPKGELNLTGIVENLYTYERAKQIDIGVVGLVPYQVEESHKVVKSVTERIPGQLQEFEDQAERKMPVSPVGIGRRKALINKAWDERHSIVSHVDDQAYPASRDEETVENFQKLADWVLYQLSNGEEGSIPESTNIIREAVEQ